MESPHPEVSLLADDGARARVHLHGAHVTSWTPAVSGVERLFLSSAADYTEGAAIRGGIPVIFPQFANLGPLPKHGFARTTAWELASVGRSEGGAAEAVLRLASSEATREIWPYGFLAELSVTVGGALLHVSLSVTNADVQPFEFTAALHTYLRVSDTRDVTIEGLEGVRYRVSGHPEEGERRGPLPIPGPVDRIYLDVPRALHVRDARSVTSISATSGFPDVVVWNPGPQGGAALSDLEPGGFARFVCVEAAVVERPVRLAPGERWRGTQRLVEERG